MIAKLALAAVLSLAATQAGRAADWPQFLGPTRDGVYAGADLAETWPTEGPPVLWQKSVGNGFSGPAVAAGRLVLFHRIGDKEIVDSFEARTGKPLWHFEYPTAYEDDFGFDPGPRATPSIADGKVFTYGAEGMLHCLDAVTGRKLWSVDTKSRFHAPKGFFGIGCSPLVTTDAVLLNVGGADGAGIVAFARDTGKVLWKTSNDEASYSSPVPATLNGKSCALFLTRNTLTILDPAVGGTILEYPFGPQEHNSVTAASPLVIGDLVFLSGCYGAGATVLRVNGSKAEKLWSEDDVLSNHYATSVHRNGFLFGIHGRTDPGLSPSPSLRCVELQTGKLRWEDTSIGTATVTLAGDQLLILTEKGELIRAPAIPDAFKPGARAQILPLEVRAYPALADGLLFARSKDKLICVDLGMPKSPASR